jgi:hypothetical protein
MFAECMRKHLTDERLRELSKRLSQPPREITDQASL